MQACDERTQKLEALGLLASGMAHDFNNVLLVMRLYSDVIRRRAEDAALQADTDEIVRAVERAQGLTRQLQIFARSRPICPEPFDPRDLAQDLVRLFRSDLPAGARLEVRHPNVLWPVLGDREQLGEALAALAANTAARLSDSGSLVVELANVTAGTEARLGDGHGDHVRIRFTDNGSAIGAEHLERIFEPFYASRRLGQGTGLGLATCDAIVSQCGGRIFAESAGETGVCFTIYLPRATDSANGPMASDPGL